MGASALLNWESHLLPFSDISTLGSQAFELELELHLYLSWFSGLQLWTGSTLLAFLRLELADNRLWDSSACIIT